MAFADKLAHGTWLHLDPASSDLVGGGGPGESAAADPDNDFGFDDGSQGNDTSSQLSSETTPSTEVVPASQATPPGMPQAGTADARQSLRDAAAAYGIDLSQHQDEQTALAHVLRLAHAGRQNDFYASLGRQLAPQASVIQEAIRQRQQQAQAPAERPSWQPPDYDQRWLSLVERDPATGVYVPKAPGVPAEIVQAINARAEWEQEFNSNPAAAIQPMVEERARAIAEELVNRRFAEQQTVQAREQIIAANADWLYARDASGRSLGTLSPLGTRYAQHVRELESDGMTDPRRIDLRARQLVHAEVVAMQGQAAPAAATQATFAAGRPNSNPLQVQPQRSAPGGTQPNAAGATLRQLMAQALDQHGVTDADFRMD